jgi:hypothetical protein
MGRLFGSQNLKQYGVTDLLKGLKAFKSNLLPVKYKIEFDIEFSRNIASDMSSYRKRFVWPQCN